MADFEFPHVGAAEIAATVSTAVAVASLALNFVLVRRQAAIQLEDLKAQVDRDILGWAGEAMRALAEAERVICELRSHGNGEVFEMSRYEVSSRLSELADRGRLFFPNLPDPFHGRDREAAFQGLRPPILDAMVFAYHAVERVQPSQHNPGAVADFLRRCRRVLVSEVQVAIDPRRRARVIAALSKARGGGGRQGFRHAGELAAALEDLFPGVTEQQKDVAWTRGYLEADA
jgi:hypothetical protein